MGETRIRRAVAGLAGVALLTASFAAAAPGAAQEPAPSIFASMTYADPVNGGPPDYIWANGMTPGEAIHLELDFEDDGTVDYTKDTFADVNGQWAYDDLGTAGRLLPGSHITLTGTDPDPDWVKDLVVQPVRVEFADPYSDGAGGVAYPGATVHLTVPLPGGGGSDLVSVDVSADGSGWWYYDFAAAGFDLGMGHTVSAALDDGDGDLSSHAEDAFRPAVHALIGAGHSGYAFLHGWPNGMPVTIEADFDDDGTVDETIPVTAYMFGPGVGFSGDFGQLQLGSRVTVTAVNGEAPFRWQKEVVLEPISVDGWSTEEDWIEGTAPPERGLRVQISTQGPSPTFVEISSDANGYWRADFGGEWDVLPGTGFDVRLPDADGDHTGIQFQVPFAPVMLNAWPTTGLWDGTPVNVYVGNMSPNSTAFLTVNVASDPFNQVTWLPGIPIGDGGFGQTTVDIPRYVGELDCASAPGACILVTADQNDPFGRNASVPLSFGRIDLFRYLLNDLQDPSAGGTVGDPITSLDQVAHTEWIWAQGTGFEPGRAYELDQCKDPFGTELCRNTWGSRGYVMADDGGAFGVPLQVGRNVFGAWGTELQVWLDPSFDLRDGQTAVVNATGLPPEGWLADCGPGQCWVGARPSGGWDMDWTPYRSDPLTFSGDPVPVTVHVAQLLKQQLEAIVHAAPAVGSEREVTWDPWTGTLAYPFTAVERWLEPDLTWGPWSPEPVEGGFYDCADELAFDPATGAQEPVRCGFSLEVREGDELYGGPFFTWVDAQFARFDLTAAVTAAATSPRPAGVTIRGEVTCTGFMPEQYLVTVEGTITQTSTKGRRSSTVTQTFATTVTCSGTMANPGKAIWTVFVPGAFKAGAATITLDVSSAGFTRSDAPLHVETAVTLTSPPKGKG